MSDLESLSRDQQVAFSVRNSFSPQNVNNFPKFCLGRSMAGMNNMKQNELETLQGFCVRKMEKFKCELKNITHESSRRLPFSFQRPAEPEVLGQSEGHSWCEARGASSHHGTLWALCYGPYLFLSSFLCVTEGSA